MTSIHAAFKALTHEQQQLINDQHISGQHTPDEWLALLSGVVQFEQQADAVEHGGGGFFARRFARKHELSGRLQSFAMQLLPVLREDHDPAAQLELTIDLTGAQQPGKQTRTSDPYEHGQYHKVVDTFYDDPWIDGHAVFADGADVRFAVIDHVRSSQKTKRSASGKTKHKTKGKTKTELAVTVSFPTRNYQAASQPAKNQPATKGSVKAGESRTVVKLSRVVQPAGADGAPELDQLLALLASAYDRVDPSRRKKL